ncbi:sperm axonemal maintenance protein CFAP97D1-like [Montipora foliosa]|uniref:sperm axonemal maintenance protein CFAP97D1-like n=1 Tax=Montipora foliosa TaxID=591990 RepID=UPI0035F17EE9
MQKLPRCYATSYAQLKHSPLNEILLLFSLFDFDSIFSIKMHRAYQPITPANNKLLKKRWDMSRYDTHRRKVFSAKAVIDNKPPQTYMHLHLKLKKLQVEEERLATIERDNRILLEKMSFVMRTRGRVDNRNDYVHKSLNKTKRQRELLRVTHENQAILKRISSKEPHYNHLQWEDEWQINEGYMDNISKYPKAWYKQLTRKKKPQEDQSQQSHNEKRRNSGQQLKSIKDKHEISENEDADSSNKAEAEDEDKETTTE